MLIKGATASETNRSCCGDLRSLNNSSGHFCFCFQFVTHLHGARSNFSFSFLFFFLNNLSPIFYRSAEAVTHTHTHLKYSCMKASNRTRLLTTIPKFLVLRLLKAFNDCFWNKVLADRSSCQIIAGTNDYFSLICRLWIMNCPGGLFLSEAIY